MFHLNLVKLCYPIQPPSYLCMEGCMLYNILYTTVYIEMYSAVYNVLFSKVYNIVLGTVHEFMPSKKRWQGGRYSSENISALKAP